MLRFIKSTIYIYSESPVFIFCNIRSTYTLNVFVYFWSDIIAELFLQIVPSGYLMNCISVYFFFVFNPEVGLEKNTL